MEPTQGRTGGGNRPSAAKRYGPLIVIVAIVAIIAIVVAVTSGGDDNQGDSPPTTGGRRRGAIPKQPWPIFTDGEQGLDQLGPELQHRRPGTVKIPYTYASPCAKPFSGDNGGATADGVTGDSIKIVVYQGDPAKNPLQAATVSKVRRRRESRLARASPTTATSTSTRSTTTSTAASSTSSTSRAPAPPTTK